MIDVISVCLVWFGVANKIYSQPGKTNKTPLSERNEERKTERKIALSSFMGGRNKKTTDQLAPKE